MKYPASRRTLLQDLHIVTREPAGIVCITLILALITVAARIAAVW